MEQIKIGTCIPGQQAEQWLPGMKDKGFECFAINFHMTYSGIDLKELAPKVMGMLEGTGTYVSTVGYYCNALQNESQLHDLEYAIDNAHLFGAKTVATFAGALEGQSIDAAIPRFKEVFSELAKRAEDRGVKLAIENCPMLFDAGQWPGGQNLATTPKIWREMFSRIPSEYFGLNYDPSHFVWQRVDYLKPLYEFKDKIFHVHYKDIKLYPDRLDDVGIMGYPLEYMAPKLPGLGDVDWGAYVSALRDIGYDGYTCVEVEDRAFEGSLENVKKSLLLSKRYIEQFVI